MKKYSIHNYLLLILLVVLGTIAVFFIRSQVPQTLSINSNNSKRLLSVQRDQACFRAKDALNNADYISLSGTTPNFANVITTGARGENYLKKLLSDENSTNYLKSMVFPSILWIIGAVIAFLGMILGACCWALGCEGQTICNDYKTEPVTSLDVKKWAFFSIVIGLALAGCSITGFIFTTKNMDTAHTATCALYTMIDHMQFGTTISVSGVNYTWAGTGLIKNKLTNVENSFKNTPINLIDTLVIDAGRLNNDYEIIKKRLAVSYASNAGKKIPTPDPLASVSDFWLDSPYIVNLGPVTDSNSLLGAIQNEVETKYQFTLSAKTITQGWTQNLSSRSKTILQSIQQSKIDAVNLDSNFTSMISSLSGLVETVNDDFPVVIALGGFLPFCSIFPFGGCLRLQCVHGHIAGLLCLLADLYTSQIPTCVHAFDMDCLGIGFYSFLLHGNVHHRSVEYGS
jgi:hypothetical protein